MGRASGQTVSIVQLVPFLKGARVFFSRGPFGAWVGGTFFFSEGCQYHFWVGVIGKPFSQVILWDWEWGV